MLENYVVKFWNHVNLPINPGNPYFGNSKHVLFVFFSCHYIQMKMF